MFLQMFCETNLCKSTTLNNHAEVISKWNYFKKNNIWNNYHHVTEVVVTEVNTFNNDQICAVHRDILVSKVRDIHEAASGMKLMSVQGVIAY